MQQQVEIKRMLELEQGLKRLNRILEEQVTGMDRNVGGLVRSVQAAYPESYVQSPSREAIRLLQELGREAQSLSDRIERKQSALRWAAGQYQSAETKAQSLLKTTPAFTWKQAGSMFSRWLQGIRDQAARGFQDVLRHPPTFSSMIQDLLRNVRDASVDRQLQSFAADAVISELFQQRESGSPAEQQQAREQLSKIAEALREIGRSQAAYSVYEKYGNKSYMKSANEHAEHQRELLQKLGVDPGFYAKTDLRTQYKGSPLSACTYNPLLTDGSAVPASDELRFAIALGLVNEKYRAWAKSNYNDIEAAVIRAEQIRELERQVAEYKRLHGPPMTLPDGTPITAENKENETTFAYFKDKVYDPSKHTGAVYTVYYAWAEDTYGMTKWRKIVVQADQVTQAFVGGLIKSTVMGVVDTAKFAFDFVIDPEKTTQETIDKVNYLVNHPEVLVDAAKAMYQHFNEGTPEQKAEMLGNAASILVPGVPIAKSGVVGKVADAVMDPLTDAVKKVPDALKNWNFPGMNPYPNRLIPATPGGPGPFEVPGQVWRSEGMGRIPSQAEGGGHWGSSGQVTKPINAPNPNAQPKGYKTTIRENMDLETKRSLSRENEAAEILAENGYDVEQNPKIPDTNKDPDYLINDTIFDCYSPKDTTSPRGIASQLEKKKIKEGQTRRIVLNLGDWNGNLSELKKQFIDWPIKNLDEVIVITKDKKVIDLLP
ncbi:hypothetical protein [Paenibacillus sp. FSL R7-0337]|uniref:CdiA C-terminal domain-containing protein n=1 Tax=Paenibacillus sp. FSL R7-0337 TaxID=1926588 RepID=UPI0009FB374C|nr:hypothetical protein [Paenibacillus sp. FSL R7-0337]